MRQLDLINGVLRGTTAEPVPACDGIDDTVPAARAPQSIAAWLSRRLRRPAQIVFTNNRSTMLTSRASGGILQLRLHHRFQQAPAEVWDAVVAYLTDQRAQAGELLDTYIAHIASHLEPAPLDLHTAGRFHNLAAIFDQLNERFFHRGCRARITWGRAGSRRYRRSILLGSYMAQDRLIRIHPSLDQAFVPERYVAWVVFHEMLHEAFGTEHRGKRRSIHPPEFVALEQTFPDFLACKQWEHDNLHRLLQFGARRS